jgi:hypothetical protein
MSQHISLICWMIPSPIFSRSFSIHSLSPLNLGLILIEGAWERGGGAHARAKHERAASREAGKELWRHAK